MQTFFYILIGLFIVIGIPNIIEYIKRKKYEAKHQQSKVSQTNAKSEIPNSTQPSTITAAKPTKIVGVRFDGQLFGSYYYKTEIYLSLGDKVIVPVTNQGQKEATVVFYKEYNKGEQLPYNGDMKYVLRKASGTSGNKKAFKNKSKNHRYYHHDTLEQEMAPESENFYDFNIDYVNDYEYNDYMSGFHTDEDGNWLPNGLGDPDDPDNWQD